MPNYDKTGPRGLGRKTGRGLGDWDTPIKTFIVEIQSLIRGHQQRGMSIVEILGNIEATKYALLNGAMNTAENLVDNEDKELKKLTKELVDFFRSMER